ncbi:MAG: undecaprenyl-diphosphate phosphatase [Candidatus Sericytochromatia bacterium]|nr:undecaprenyl-diphosphate phosphatase [Candidatus Sericytochromatia bacterium]
MSAPLAQDSPVDAFQAITLGIVQGLTEFLPISSTAHLALVPWAFGWQDPGHTFDVALHAGTLIAVTAYFWDDLRRMAVAFARSLIGLLRRTPSPRSLGAAALEAPSGPAAPDPHGVLAWMVVAGSVPAVLAGVLIEKWVETTLRSPLVIAGTLIGVALLIWVIDRRASGHRAWQDLRLKDAVLIGVAQACALVPGVSRSGATITMGLLLGLSRADAARFSFLLGFPVILGSTVFKLRHLFEDASLQALAPWMALGAAAAALSGYACIAFLLRFLASRTMLTFVLYRVALGSLILFLVAMGWAPKIGG